MSVAEVLQFLEREISINGVPFPSIRDIRNQLLEERQANATISTIQEAFQQLAIKGTIDKDGDRFVIKSRSPESTVVPTFGHGANLVFHHARRSTEANYRIRVRETFLPAWRVHRIKLKEPAILLDGDTDHDDQGFFYQLVETLRYRTAEGRRTEIQIALQSPSEAAGLMRRLAQVENVPIEIEDLTKGEFAPDTGAELPNGGEMASFLSSTTMVSQMRRCFQNLRRINSAISNTSSNGLAEMKLRLFSTWNSFPLIIGEGVACKGDYATYSSCWEIPALFVFEGSPFLAMCDKDMHKTWKSALPTSLNLPQISEGEDPKKYLDSVVSAAVEELADSEVKDDPLTADVLRSCLERLLEGAEFEAKKGEDWRFTPWRESLKAREGCPVGSPQATVAMMHRSFGRG